MHFKLKINQKLLSQLKLCKHGNDLFSSLFSFCESEYFFLDFLSIFEKHNLVILFIPRDSKFKKIGVKNIG